MRLLIAMTRKTVQDRLDPAVAEAVIGEVFRGSPGSAKQTYIEFLIEDIKYLNSRHNNRWGVTLFGWGLRLNVGWVECLVLHPRGLRVLLDDSSAPAHTRFERRLYRLAPGCKMTSVPLSKLSQVLPFLEEAHRVGLDSPANRNPPRNIRGAHSLGVTKFLSRFARVLNPSYVPSVDVHVL